MKYKKLKSANYMNFKAFLGKNYTLQTGQGLYQGEFLQSNL